MTQDVTQTEELLTGHEVRFSIHRKPNCIVSFDVEAMPGLVAKAHTEAVKAVAKEVTLPGFRKGKAPEEMVAKKFPKDVDKKWQEVIANLAFRECSTVAKIPTLQGAETRISFSMKQHDMKKGAHLSLEFETDPVIPEIEPKKITIKSVKRPEVNAEKVDETIRQVQLFFATWAPVTDRAVQKGDFVMLDVDIIEEHPATPLFQNTRFEVVEKSMAKWMRDLVIGKSAGDSIEGVSQPDDDVPEEEKKAFLPKKVRVTIKAIQTADIPPLDEELLKKLGVASQDEMRNNIEATLTKQADRHVAEKMREQVTEQIFDKFPFDLPRTLIEKEARFRMNQLMGDEEFAKGWQHTSNEEKRKMIESIFLYSEKAVRLFYLCRKILKDANIPVSPSDVLNRPSKPLDILLDPQHLMHMQQPSQAHQAEAFSKIILEKAQDFLANNATIDNQ